MKNLMKFAVAALFMFAACFGVSAQQVKIGYINFDELVQQMPDFAKVNEELEAKYNQIEEQRTSMMEEYQAAVKEYNEKVDTYTSNIVRQAKEQEILQMQQRIQNFMELADAELTKNQQELLEPVINKARDAISKVAKANGFSYIIQSAVLLYMSPDSYDVMPLVKKELGI